MNYYYQNSYVVWEGAGWYILYKNSPTWKNEWIKAESLDQLDDAAAHGQNTAYLVKSILQEVS